MENNHMLNIFVTEGKSLKNLYNEMLISFLFKSRDSVHFSH